MFVNVNIGVKRIEQIVIDAIEKKLKDSSIYFDNDGGDYNTYNINAGFDSPKQAYDFANEIKESFDVYVDTESFIGGSV